MDEIEKRIGDPTRDKWLPFLGRALELGYIPAEEYQRRADIVLSAVTIKDINPVIDDLPWESWSEAWDEGRKKGLHPKLGILPEEKVPEKKGIAVLPVLTFLCIILGILCIALAAKAFG